MIVILDGITEAEMERFEHYFGDSEARDISEFTFVDGAPVLKELEVASDVVQVFSKYPDPTGNKAEDRITDLLLATLGVRYWGPRLTEDYPTYAGIYPTSYFEWVQVALDTLYVATRRKYLSSFGVNYIGRVHSSPRSVLVLDPTRNTSPATMMENPKVQNLLNSVPDDFWGKTSFISTLSSKKLEFFLEEHDQTIPISTSTKSDAKLKFAGLDHVAIVLPSEPSREYGIKLRASVTLFERQ